MSKLSTKGIKSGSVTPKEIQPGNITAKINSIFLEDVKYKVGGKDLKVQLESSEMPAGFEGFYLDKTNPDMGRYKGQVSRVKLTEWAFADGETKTGIVVSRDTEILKVLKQLCEALECSDWLEAQDDKHDTIDSLINKFNEDRPFGNKFLDFCIAGKEYKNKQGYDAYDLFLPKFTRKGIPFEKAGLNSGKLLKFDRTEHIKKNPKAVEKAVVEDFDTDVQTSKGTSQEFEL